MFWEVVFLDHMQSLAKLRACQNLRKSNSKNRPKPVGNHRLSLDCTCVFPKNRYIDIEIQRYRYIDIQIYRYRDTVHTARLTGVSPGGAGPQRERQQLHQDLQCSTVTVIHQDRQNTLLTVFLHQDRQNTANLGTLRVGNGQMFKVAVPRDF